MLVNVPSMEHVDIWNMDFVACFGLLWIALVLTSLEYLQEVKIRSTLHPPVSIYGGKNPKLNGQKMWKCFHPPPRTLHRLVDGIPPGPTWWHIATFDSWRWCHCGIFSWGNGGIIYDKDWIIIANDGINVNGIREHPSCLTMISQAAQAQTRGEYTEVRTKPRIVRYCQ